VADPPAALADALHDRYELQRELGRGGMATVYLARDLARDLRHERPVALKVLRPELAATVGSERFLQEIKLARPQQWRLASWTTFGLLRTSSPLMDPATPSVE
jgi:serine/threonine protein kinase